MKIKNPPPVPVAQTVTSTTNLPAQSEPRNPELFGTDPNEQRIALAPVVTAPVTAPPPTITKPFPLGGTGATSFDTIGNIIRDVTPLSSNKTMFGLDGWTLQFPNVLTGETRWHPSMKAEAVLKAGLEALAPPPELGSWNIWQNIERKSEHDQRLNDLYDQLAEAWTRDEKKSFRNDAGEVFDQWGQEDFKAEAFDLLLTHAGPDFVVTESLKTFKSRGGEEAKRLDEAVARFGSEQVGTWLIQNRGVVGFDQVLQKKLGATVEVPRESNRSEILGDDGSKTPPLSQIQNMAKNRPLTADLETQLSYEEALQNLLTARLQSGHTTSQEDEALGQLMVESKGVVESLRQRQQTDPQDALGAKVKIPRRGAVTGSEAAELEKKAAEERQQRVDDALFRINEGLSTVEKERSRLEGADRAAFDQRAQEAGLRPRVAPGPTNVLGTTGPDNLTMSRPATMKEQLVKAGIAEWADENGDIFVNYVDDPDGGSMVILPGMSGSHKEGAADLGYRIDTQDPPDLPAGEMHFRIENGELELISVSRRSGTLKPKEEMLQEMKKLLGSDASGFKTERITFSNDVDKNLDPRLNKEPYLVREVRHDLPGQVLHALRMVKPAEKDPAMLSRILMAPAWGFFLEKEGLWIKAGKIDPTLKKMHEGLTKLWQETNEAKALNVLHKGANGGREPNLQEQKAAIRQAIEASLALNKKTIGKTLEADLQRHLERTFTDKKAVSAAMLDPDVQKELEQAKQWAQQLLESRVRERLGQRSERQGIPEGQLDARLDEAIDESLRLAAQVAFKQSAPDAKPEHAPSQIASRGYDTVREGVQKTVTRNADEAARLQQLLTQSLSGSGPYAERIATALEEAKMDANQTYFDFTEQLEQNIIRIKFKKPTRRRSEPRPEPPSQP